MSATFATTLILFSISVTCGALAGGIIGMMIGQINASDGMRDRFSFWGMNPIKFQQIISTHEHLFPESKLRFQYGLLVVVSVIMFLAAISNALFRLV